MFHGAREDIGDRLDPAVGMPGEAAHVVAGVFVAEIVEEQERVHPFGIAEAEGAVEVDAAPHRSAGRGFRG